MKNRCDSCGKFKPWKELSTYGADTGNGTSVDVLECDDCTPEASK